MKKQTIILASLLLALIYELTNAQIPQARTYQGVLTDSFINPKPDDALTFTFHLYDVQRGGAAPKTEMKDLQVKRGLVSTTHEDITSFPPTDIFDKIAETPKFRSFSPESLVVKVGGKVIKPTKRGNGIPNVANVLAEMVA